MPDNPYHHRDSAGLIGPVNCERMHPITASANPLKTVGNADYIPRALWADVAGSVVATTPQGRSVTIPLTAGPNPVGGMTHITTITTITTLLGVE